jgi:hypothetical protein
MVTSWRPNPSLHPNPEEGNSRETKKTQQEDDTLATLDRRRRPIGDERGNLSYNFEHYSPIKCDQSHTTLHSQTQEGKHKKAQQEDDTLQRSIEDEPRNLSYEFEFTTSSDTLPSNVISLHHPHCTLPPQESKPKKTQQEHDTLGRTIDAEE